MSHTSSSSVFNRYAGLAAILAALAGLLYSVAFVVLQNALLYSICLMLGGLLSVVALVALFERLGEVDSDVAPACFSLFLSPAIGKKTSCAPIAYAK